MWWGVGGSIVGALWGVAARTCSILLTTFLCNCRLASSPAFLLAFCYMSGRICVSFYRSGLTSSFILKRIQNWHTASNRKRTVKTSTYTVHVQKLMLTQKHFINYCFLLKIKLKKTISQLNLMLIILMFVLFKNHFRINLLSQYPEDSFATILSYVLLWTCYI